MTEDRALLAKALEILSDPLMETLLAATREHMAQDGYMAAADAYAKLHLQIKLILLQDAAQRPSCDTMREEPPVHPAP